MAVASAPLQAPRHRFMPKQVSVCAQGRSFETMALLNPTAGLSSFLPNLARPAWLRLPHNLLRSLPTISL